MLTKTKEAFGLFFLNFTNVPIDDHMRPFVF